MNDPGLTQNQGNVLGDRPCVRQSKLYREQVGGNDMKALLGQEHLQWDTTQTQGCYSGGSVYDHNTSNHIAVKKEAGQNEGRYNQRGSNQNNNSQFQTSSGAYGNPNANVNNYGKNNNNHNINNNNNNNRQTTSGAYGNANNNNDNLGNNNNNVSVSTGKACRPGAGYANRQTYNIFTGESS